MYVVRSPPPEIVSWCCCPHAGRKTRSCQSVPPFCLKLATCSSEKIGELPMSLERILTISANSPASNTSHSLMRYDREPCAEYVTLNPFLVPFFVVTM